MARLSVSFLLLNLVIYMAAAAESATATATTDFIKSSCRATRYPALCLQCLSGYASVIRQSQRQLAITALSVSISRTRSCASFVRKLGQAKGTRSRDHGAVRDCIENMGDSVDRLSQSVRELGRTGRAVGADFEWHMSNVQTWVSAALTDQDTCLDGFDGPQPHRLDPNLKAAIRRRVFSVAQVTSNALALVNRFASSHRAH